MWVNIVLLSRQRSNIHAAPFVTHVGKPNMGFAVELRWENSTITLLEPTDVNIADTDFLAVITRQFVQWTPVILALTFLPENGAYFFRIRNLYRLPIWIYVSKRDGQTDSPSSVNASLTLGGRPSPSLLPCSPPFLSPPHLTPPSPPLPLEVGPLNPWGSGSGGALLAPPAPKSNLVHFSLKIRHLVAKFLMILVKSQLTEKQVVYIVKTIFTVMEVCLLSPDNINICCVAILQTHPLSLHVHRIIDENTDTSHTIRK